MESLWWNRVLNPDVPGLYTNPQDSLSLQLQSCLKSISFAVLSPSLAASWKDLSNGLKLVFMTAPLWTIWSPGLICWCFCKYSVDSWQTRPCQTYNIMVWPNTHWSQWKTPIASGLSSKVMKEAKNKSQHNIDRLGDSPLAITTWAFHGRDEFYWSWPNNVSSINQIT